MFLTKGSKFRHLTEFAYVTLLNPILFPGTLCFPPPNGGETLGTKLVKTSFGVVLPDDVTYDELMAVTGCSL